MAWEVSYILRGCYDGVGGADVKIARIRRWWWEVNNWEIPKTEGAR